VNGTSYATNPSNGGCNYTANWVNNGSTFCLNCNIYQQKIDNIRWVSLQTRNLNTQYPDILEQSYQLKRSPIYEKQLSIISRNKEISVYKTEDLPITVSLLHIRNQEYEYPNFGTLNSALETFRTIIQFSSLS
jgi:hypothetical protein